MEKGKMSLGNPLFDSITSVADNAKAEASQLRFFIVQ